MLSYADFSTVLALIPPKMIVSFQFVKQLNDLGSGTVQLNMDDPWWHTATLTDGKPRSSCWTTSACGRSSMTACIRFEFLGETVTEQLVDPSEQRIVTVTGPGAAATLKWAMAAPQGFPDIVLKVDAISDAFSEVDVSGNPVLDTNIWNAITPPGSASSPRSPRCSPSRAGPRAPTSCFPRGR